MFRSILDVRPGDVITGDNDGRFDKPLRIASVERLHPDSHLDPTRKVTVRPANNPQGGMTTWSVHPNYRVTTER